MKETINKYGNRLSAIFCSIFGHHFGVTKEITSHIKEYKCVHCNKEVTTDASGNLSELTPELQDINNTLEHIYQKRHNSNQQVA
ncbi:hypothetical protein [Arenibacter latericius]|uniref:hypothetical protein n=1 Tax=Arenibacter latericius TaxID=86104 RepID=UPI0003FBFEA1|nr:hypothetical protein [Arenibacter latericius]MDX1363480.1 hypothetical protein [Arenibacter latericius]